MSKPLAGIRILEVASHVFVPIAGGMLVEQGAEIIKVEKPETGDPYRSLVTMGLHQAFDGIHVSFQYTNRGKQSVAIDLKTKEGLELLYKLAAKSDVFLTNMRPDARRRLKIDVDDIRAQNPDIVYARGTGYGPEGPDAQRGGYDAAAYWARSGVGSMFTPPGAQTPPTQRPAFGDVMGGMAIAGAIAAALYQRATTGKAPVVDVSLLNIGMWQLQPDIVHAKLSPGGFPASRDRKVSWNPIVGNYRTRDGRFILLNMMEGDRYWADLCQVVGKPEWIDDPRFVDMEARKTNSSDCITLLDELFASRDFADWCEILKPCKGVWSPMHTPLEVHDDPQAKANGYLADVEMINGSTLTVVTSPAKFDGEIAQPTRGPELGEHTETVLLDLGLSWEDIADLKDKGAIG